MARPTKYSEERAKQIGERLRQGATRAAAAQSSGVSCRTFERWLRTRPDFAGTVTQREAEAELAFTLTLTAAARAGDWQAALEWLKRRRRSEWGDRVQAPCPVCLEAKLERLFAELSS